MDTGGFVINSKNANIYIGTSVSSAGDVNGDGLDDLIIGSSHSNVNGKKAAGKSYVIFGKKDSTEIDLSAITNGSGTGGFVINGENKGDFSGDSVSNAGDVNGDCLDDLIVGARYADLAAPKAPIIKSSKPSPLSPPQAILTAMAWMI
jgi:hypothetical protein